jgi:hypothetical protein
MISRSPIPPITNPLGKHWPQPPLNAIVIDDTHALMSEATLKVLPEYSCTIPTGVYPGKMWKRHDGLFDQRCKPSDRCWLLCWFGESDKGPDFCSINSRKVIIA